MTTVGRPTIEESAPMLSCVVRDAADKAHESYAVVLRGDLVPVRFTTKREAVIHLRGLTGAGQ